MLSHHHSCQVASPTKNFLNDVVVDPQRRLAYIADPGGVALLVYDDRQKSAWRFTHPSFEATNRGFEVGAWTSNLIVVRLDVRMNAHGWRG